MPGGKQRYVYLATAGYDGGPFEVLGAYPDYASAHAHVLRVRDGDDGYYHVERYPVDERAGPDADPIAG
jgi:hypothetical protein